MRIVLVTLANRRCHSGQEKMKNCVNDKTGITDSVEWSWEQFEQSSWFKENTDIFQEKRGLGYWAWKPFIILDALDKLDDGDVVLYHDAGRPCYDWHIDHNVTKFINKIKNDNNGLGIVFGPFKHGEYCKRDTLIEMDCDEDKITNHKQVSATWSFWTKNDFCLNVLQEWKEWNVNCKRLITDDHSVAIEYDMFKGHRHDQSILTNILLKRHFEDSNGFSLIFSRRKYEKNINNFIA